MLTCRKCGAELHEEQKVCIVCGTRTIRGDGFDYTVEKWKPTKNQKIIAGGVLFLLIVIWIVKAMQVTPPDMVAKDFFDAMTQRQIGTAKQMVSPALESDLQNRNMDLRAVADEYYTEVVNDQAKYQVSRPNVSGANAVVAVMLQYPDGTSKQVNIEMVKDGRRWLVSGIM